MCCHVSWEEFVKVLKNQHVFSYTCQRFQRPQVSQSVMMEVKVELV